MTGANRGVGRLLAQGLADTGLDVALLGRDEAALQAVAATLPTRAVPVVADVRDAASVEAAVSRAQDRLGPIDLLVNNAGVIEGEEVPLWEADADDWRRVVETNVVGTFHVTRSVTARMVAAGGGRVVTITSGAGAADRDVYSAYCASKAALFRITGNLHLAGYRHGLRAFDLAPGVIRSDMTLGMPLHEGRTSWTPPEELVALVAAVAAGRLDSWAGCFLRAGLDTPEGLEAVARDAGGVAPHWRRLSVVPWGDGDPMVTPPYP